MRPAREVGKDVRGKAQGKAREEGRVAARMPVEMQERIMQAATLTGATLNQFLVSAAIDKANEVLERERVINLNFESAKIVLDLMSNPPQPNEALKKAMERRRLLLEGDGTDQSP